MNSWTVNNTETQTIIRDDNIVYHTMIGRVGSAVLPARISERIFTRKRDIDVDYSSLDYEVHIPTYNEEDFIEETLKSLNRQSPIQNGDVDLILVDSYSTDDTVKIARQYVDDVIFAPKGILTARNESMTARSPDVVISADAADVYPRGWINEHTKAFEDDDVVATLGPVYSKENPFKRPQKIKHSIVNIWNLPGNNSAIRVEALENIGGFYTDLNQQELVQVLLEEQIFKKAELYLQGDIEFRPFAGMYKSQRRKKFSIERTREYAKQQAQNERF